MSVAWTEEGKSSVLPGLDLAPPTIRVEGWLNVYQRGLSTFYNSLHDANAIAAPSRIACIHIERDVTPGEGLGEKTKREDRY